MDPVVFGPTWQREEDGTFALPTPMQTVGYRVGLWAERELTQPDGDHAGGPLRLTDEQWRFLAHWYRVDESGRFAWRTGSFVRIKGAGKDLLGAVLCAVELCGPCRPVLDDNGRLVADADGLVAGPVAAPWVQLAAVNITQTQNTMRYFPSLLSNQFLREHAVDVGKETIYAGSSGKLQAVTSSPRALEGARPTFCLVNESHHWLASNNGHEMYAVIVRNLAKQQRGSARVLEITNAHAPGEDSIAEQSYDAYQQRLGAGDVGDQLYDSLQAPAEVDLSEPDSVREGIRLARGDAQWLDLDTYMSIIVDPRSSVADSRRFFLNQIVAADRSLIAPMEWDACVTPGAELVDGDAITLGFDGAKSQDATALVACRLSDRCLFPIAIQESDPKDPDWRVDKDYFDQAVDRCFDRFTVWAFYADVAQFEGEVEEWEWRYQRTLKGRASRASRVAFDMRGNDKRVTAGVEALVEGVTSGFVRHDGDALLRAHALNAVRRPNRWGVSFGKEHRESRRKVDGLAAALLADIARRELVSSGKYRGDRKVSVIA